MDESWKKLFESLDAKVADLDGTARDLRRAMRAAEKRLSAVAEDSSMLALSLAAKVDALGSGGRGDAASDLSKKLFGEGGRLDVAEARARLKQSPIAVTRSSHQTQSAQERPPAVFESFVRPLTLKGHDSRTPVGSPELTSLKVSSFV
jgi:hypothetical protein